MVLKEQGAEQGGPAREKIGDPSIFDNFMYFFGFSGLGHFFDFSLKFTGFMGREWARKDGIGCGF